MSDQFQGKKKLHSETTSVYTKTDSEMTMTDQTEELQALLLDEPQTSRREATVKSFDQEPATSLLKTRPFEKLEVGVSSYIKWRQKHWWIRLKNIVNPRAKGIALLNVLTILYGSNVSIIKRTEANLDPAIFSAGRFAIAALVFSPFLWSALKDKHLRSAGIELGLLASIAYLTQCIGLLTTEAGRASFICTFTVIVVPILSRFFGVKIPKITWAASGVSLLGVGLLESSGAPASVGDLWSFISAVFFGVHMLRTELHTRTFPPTVSMSLLSLQLFVIVVLSSIWSFWSKFNLKTFTLIWKEMNAISLMQGLAVLPWLPMLYTGLLSTAFCLWIELVSMRNVSATEAAIIYTLEPLWGAGFAWSLLGERWGPTGWLGAVFILAGSLTVQLFGRVEHLSSSTTTIEDSANEATSSSLAPALDREVGTNEYCDTKS